MSEANPPPSDASPFEQIVDDGDARQQSLDWAYAEIVGGRTPEAVEADLLSAGWSADDAATMAEEARKRSRHLRGVVTREQVALVSEARYRKALNDNVHMMGERKLTGLQVDLSQEDYPDRPQSSKPRKKAPEYLAIVAIGVLIAIGGALWQHFSGGWDQSPVILGLMCGVPITAVGLFLYWRGR